MDTMVTCKKCRTEYDMENGSCHVCDMQKIMKDDIENVEAALVRTTEAIKQFKLNDTKATRVKFRAERTMLSTLMKELIDDMEYCDNHNE